jgi:16S rRNA processing protein RimM
MTRDVLLGAVIGAHGLKGEVKVKTFTDTPLDAYGALHAKDGRTFHVVAARPAKSGIAVMRLREIGDRDAAEALKGTELFVARSALLPAGDDEFYHADLIGLAVADAQGRTLGTVKALHNFGAGDVIEIAKSDGNELFLPFTHEIVPAIDLAAGRIVVVAPEETDAGDHEP